MTEKKQRPFDFDRWAALARERPEEFERLRETAITELIDSAPESLRQRLRGAQWQIDVVRQRARTPIAACLQLSDMMWDRVIGDDGLLVTLDQLARAAEGKPVRHTTATILSFPDGPSEYEEEPEDTD